MKYGILNFSTETTVEDEIIGGESIQCFKCKSEDDLPDSISRLEACMVWHELQVTKTTIDRLKNCKVIVCVGVGFNNVDTKYAGSAGIPVVNIPDYGTNDVADHTFALLLSLCRKITTYNSKLKENPALNWDVSLGGVIHRLTNAKLGIAGLGRIGTAVAGRAKAFGMDVSFYDPYIPDGYDKSLNIKRFSDLKSMFAVSDYICIHTPLTDETYHMIGAEVLESAKTGITLINTARGAIVDLDAVYNSLKSGKLGTFASDVMEIEPPENANPLIRAFSKGEPWLDGRMILTPHSAFYAVESRHEMREKAARQMWNAVNGIPLRNCVNKEYLITSGGVIHG
ncbi:hypothetical protein FACS1894190_14550 [Spirochaetia bacterium]|nr:hypothetical protein FACS1894190_14550 [Spirochaetia bacterium]GHV20487.1 hypothetical protein FACS189494_04340 [Spirochaetia bacterium]